MLVTCPECATRYEVDDSAFSAGGRAVRCNHCGCEWYQIGPSIPTAVAASSEPQPTRMLDESDRAAADRSAAAATKRDPFAYSDADEDDIDDIASAPAPRRDRVDPPFGSADHRRKDPDIQLPAVVSQDAAKARANARKGNRSNGSGVSAAVFGLIGVAAAGVIGAVLFAPDMVNQMLAGVGQTSTPVSAAFTASEPTAPETRTDTATTVAPPPLEETSIATLGSGDPLEGVVPSTEQVGAPFGGSSSDAEPAPFGSSDPLEGGVPSAPDGDAAISSPIVREDQAVLSDPGEGALSSSPSESAPSSTVQSGVVFVDSKYDLVERPEGPALEIWGIVANNGPGDVVAPTIEIVSRDESGEVLQTWYAQPEVDLLAVGQKARFTSRMMFPAGPVHNVDFYLSNQ